jgi:phosphoribosylanthranilate isomerase
VIDMIQLHGDEDAAYIRGLRKLTRAPVIKAVRVGSGMNFLGDACPEADFLLFDTFREGERGGTGARFDWKLLPRSGMCPRPYFLAGGLDAAGIAEARAQPDLAPFGFDVSGGAETDGYKDFEKMRAIIDAARAEERNGHIYD